MIAKCPFCGCANVYAFKIKLDVPKTYHVVCHGCGASGAWGIDEQEAENNWNERYDPRLTIPDRRLCFEQGNYTHEGD